jgi:hypothetical protein
VTSYKAAQIQGDNKQTKSINDQAKTRADWRIVMKFPIRSKIKRRSRKMLYIILTIQQNPRHSHDDDDDDVVVVVVDDEDDYNNNNNNNNRVNLNSVVA